MATVKQQLKAAYSERTALEKAATANRKDRKTNNELIARLEAEIAAAKAPAAGEAQTVSPEGIESAEAVGQE